MARKRYTAEQIIGCYRSNNQLLEPSLVFG